MPQLANLQQQLIRHFRETFADLVGERLVVALSGGADSVALLHLLHSPELSLTLEVAHVHHGARGQEADDDAAFCHQLSRKLGLPFHHLTLPVDDPAPEGREAAWRRLRYQALLDLAGHCRAAALATGHHSDDVAEGVVLQLLRGTGPRGLAGIATRTRAGIIRPLLSWRHSDLVGWLEERQIAWREDSSNLDHGHLRNLVRHRLLATLEELSPQIRRHLQRLATALAEDEAYLSAELERLARWIDPWHPEGGVAVAVIRRFAPALRNRWLHAQAERSGIGKVSSAQIDHLRRLLDYGRPRAVALGGRWHLRLAHGHLWLEPPLSLPAYCLILDPADPPDLPLPGWSIKIHRSPMESPSLWRWHPPKGKKTLIVRSPQQGQSAILPSGESLAKILCNRLPRHLRTVWPLFCIDDTIDWIPGVWQHTATGSEGSLVVEVARK
jgi:tRNA(Ile)-lysidine synthetase-like protein